LDFNVNAAWRKYLSFENREPGLPEVHDRIIIMLSIMGYKILYTSINYHIGNTFYDLTMSNSRKNNTFGTSKEGTVTGEKLQIRRKRPPVFSGGAVL